MRARVLSCPTLCDPMDCGPPGFSVHGILQARRPERVAISSSRGSSRPRDGTHISHAFSSGFFTASTPWEALEEERWNTSPCCRHRPRALLRIFPPSSNDSCLPGTFMHILFTLSKHQPCGAGKSGIRLILHVKKSRSHSEPGPLSPRPALPRSA